MKYLPINIFVTVFTVAVVGSDALAAVADARRLS